MFTVLLRAIVYVFGIALVCTCAVGLFFIQRDGEKRKESSPSGSWILFSARVNIYGSLEETRWAVSLGSFCSGCGGNPERCERKFSLRFRLLANQFNYPCVTDLFGIASMKVMYDWHPSGNLVKLFISIKIFKGHL